MSVTPTKVLGWSSIQGILAAILIFAVGGPAGFSLYGFSWKLPWDQELAATPRDKPLAEAAGTVPLISIPQRSPLTVERIWSSPSTVVFCVSVKNDQNRSMSIRSGHLNLSEVGIADIDWASAAPLTWEARRLQVANVQIIADREAPGTVHGFILDLTVPPGHERKFLLQIQAVNVPASDQNRFCAVGSLVLEDGTAELATPDIDLFGARLAQGDRHVGVSPVATRVEPLSPLRRELRTEAPVAQRPPAYAVRPPEPPSSVEKLTNQLGKVRSYATDLRNKIPLPFTSTTFNLPPPPNTSSPELSPPPSFAGQRAIPER